MLTPFLSDFGRMWFIVRFFPIRVTLARLPSACGFVQASIISTLIFTSLQISQKSHILCCHFISSAIVDIQVPLFHMLSQGLRNLILTPIDATNKWWYFSEIDVQVVNYFASDLLILSNLNFLSSHSTFTAPRLEWLPKINTFPERSHLNVPEPFNRTVYPTS